MIKDIRIHLMGLFYSGKKASEVSDEMEVFFDILKQYDNYRIDDLDLVLKKSKQSQIIKDNISDDVSSSDNLIDILKSNGISSSNYEDITIEQIELLDKKGLLTKALTIQLANLIGISKKSYKSRKDVYEDIYRMINNRDTMNATKNVLINDSSKQ